MSDLCRFINNGYTDAAPFTAIFSILQPDPVVAAAFHATYPNGRTGLSPIGAAALYGATVGGPVSPTTPALMIPAIYAALPGLDQNLASASSLSSTLLDVCGNRCAYEWIMYMDLSGPTAAAAVPEGIKQRRFIHGFELPEGGEGGSVGSTLGNDICRDASRTPEGFGLALRNRAIIFTQTLTEFTGGGASFFRNSWERMYVRLRGVPTAEPVFWRSRNTANNIHGAALTITPAGNLRVYNVNAAGTFNLIATSVGFFSPNVWELLDLVVQFNDGTDNARIQIWKNHTQVINVAVAAANQGLALAGFHTSSELGNTNSGDNLELDIDDWINAEPPVAFTGLDWNAGSHIVAARPTAYDASHSVNWAGDVRALMQNPPFRATAVVTSSTASARMAVASEAQLFKDRNWTQQGSPAFLVALYSKNAGATDGQLGYKIGVGADVLAGIDQVAGFTWQGMMYRPSGLGSAPVAIEPLVLLHTKSADANLDTTEMLMAAIEYLGTFGAVDQATGTAAPPDMGIHNAPYVAPNGQWGGPGAPPFGSYSVMSGTYVGNGTGQDVNLTEPAHFLYIRPLTGSTGGGHWWTSMIGPHFRVDLRAIFPDQMVQMVVDASGQAKFRVVGTGSDANAIGVTYQYVAVSDPSMRFMANGAFMRDSTLVSAVNLIADPTFYPEGSFLQVEKVGEAGLGISGAYYKGKGHGSSRASLLDAAETANALSFGLGILNSQTPFHTQDRSTAHSSWRIFDAPGTASGPATAHCDGSTTDRAVAITSYVGDGTGARSIPVALNNRFPLWAVVVPHNGAAYVRDPGHTGTNSSLYTLDGTSATAITGGGANAITVGVTLNTLGVIYEVFALPGATTGNADGWSAAGTYYPVPPRAPCSGLWGAGAMPTPPPVAGTACLDDFGTDLT